MPEETAPQTNRYLRAAAAILGTALLVYLIGQGWIRQATRECQDDRLGHSPRSRAGRCWAYRKDPGLAAERRLDRWLVKPTDGIFARMNRRISIPISRQLIKLPITPNMVTLSTLGVSLASGLYFAFGGYWNTLLGAVLSLWASILDGCDGEAARLKLQSAAFGCWLETTCDYLYYLFIFAGMSIGLTRSMHADRFLFWGAALFVGAILTFLIAGLGRQRLSGQNPEQYLAVWHNKAEARLSNPLIYLGRHTEFMVRRCFLPYTLLVLAVFNFTPAALYSSAIGANLAWVISLYIYIAFTRKQHFASTAAAMPASATKAIAA